MVPARRPEKSPSKPRNCTIRSIFPSLKYAAPTVSDAVHAVHAVWISNDICGSDKMSADELAMGYPKPVCAIQKQNPGDGALLPVHAKVITKKKYTLILLSNVYPPESFKSGDLVLVFKRTEWKNWK